MKVSDVMVRGGFTCSDNATLADVAGQFWLHGIGFLPVVSATTGKVCGVVTDRDVCICSYFEDLPLRQIPVTRAMSSRLFAIGPDEEIDAAEQLLAEAQVRRLPVIVDGALAGVLSIDDIARKAAAAQDGPWEEAVALTLGAISQPRSIETTR